MAWWNRSPKPADEISDPRSVPLKFGDTVISQTLKTIPGGTIPETTKGSPFIHCDDPEEVVVGPEPDLSTKPEDLVGYCFGYVCPKKHIGEMFESITIDGYKQRRACQTCGAVSKPAVIKKIAEAKWEDYGSYINRVTFKMVEPDWRWGHFHPDFGRLRLFDIRWTKHEFVHYLEIPRRRRSK